mmetsp:Transcript_8151/g.13736  ORF Transcript_8151/g.13736 Transcript_8151/m.13736 type:complete len:360 (-) Transcript_8151:16-1095(-)
MQANIMKGNEGRIESSLKATFNEATDKNLSKKRKIEDGNDLSGIYADSVKANSTAAANQGVLPSLNKNERVIKPSSLWNFAVDYNDHFETPPTAYKDLSPVLEALAHCVCKTTAELTVYDPYWCEGSMVSHMRELGYENVINRNRDFYMDIKKKNIPGYDVLVTNPPYSGEHKVNLLKFLATHTAANSANNSRNSVVTSTTPEKSIAAAENKNTNNADKVKPTTLPFALLLPVYTATKSYWKDFVHAQSLLGKNSFYILPPDYYEYSHPEGTGKDIPPFYSAWFLGGFSTEQKNSIIQSLRTKPRTAIPTKPTNPPLKRLSFPVLTVAESVEALVSRGVVTDSKRPNPKQRQKMKQKGK